MKAINRLGYLLLFLLVGSLMPISIMVAGGIALRQRQQQSKTIKQIAPKTCSIDTDCPPGLVCVDGFCVAFEE